ncbi:cell division protein FtsX [Trichothermofontia sp.]
MLEALTRLDYLLRETWLGLRRGGWMNWAAISTVTILLFLFGSGLQTSWHLERLVNQFGNQLEISIFLEPGVLADEIVPIVREMPEVANLEIVSKEQAWETLIAELGLSDIRGATAQLNGNPLVDELKVLARNPDAVPPLVDRFQALPGVEAVQYLPEVLQRLRELNQGLNWVSLTITTLLTGSAIAVIMTTIRLIVLARDREIEIMQLVGATRAWIYLPFLFQGIVFGVAGAILAWVLLGTFQQTLGNLLAGQPDFIRFLFSQGSGRVSLHALPDFVLLPLILISFGSVIGLTGSFFAVQRSVR